MGGLLAALQTAKAQRSAKNAASEEAAASSSSSSSSVETGVIADPAHPEVHAPWAPEEAAASHLQLVRKKVSVGFEIIFLLLLAQARGRHLLMSKGGGFKNRSYNY
jgi:hypothetical protein